MGEQERERESKRTRGRGRESKREQLGRERERDTVRERGEEQEMLWWCFVLILSGQFKRYSATYDDSLLHKEELREEGGEAGAPAAASC